MATDEEIAAMVAVYNGVEHDQLERLRFIFDAIDSRAGFRRVQFGDGENDSVAVWSNAWGRRPDLARKSFITPMARFITDVVPGETNG